MLDADQKADARPLPIFKPELRAAIREGRKTQTRRLMKGTPIEPLCISEASDGTMLVGQGNGTVPSSWIRCQYGKVGDICYLREPLVRFKDDNAGDCAGYSDSVERFEEGTDNESQEIGELVDEHLGGMPWEWKRDTLPSIHMPRKAARTFVRLKDIRIERLQEISDDDARAEGLPDPMFEQEDFRKLWQSIHGTESWTENPWVWVVEWELLK